MLCNIRSLNNKVNEFYAEISSKSYDIIALCETWLNDSTPNSLLDCNDNYTIIRKDRDTRGGGVCFFISKSFTTNVSQVIIPDLYKSLEVVAIDVSFGRMKTRLILLYRPPGNSYDIVLNELLVSALDYLSSSSCQRHVILGDFNLPTIDWPNCYFPSNQPYSCLCEYIFNSGYHQVVNSPTREQNILDLVLVSDLFIVSSVTVLPPISSRK